MRISLKGRNLMVVVVVLALGAVVVPFAMRAAGANVIEACVNPGNGNLRLVDASTQCHNNETRVQWNEEGPQGPPGPQGPQGPPGTSSGGPPFVWVCTPAHLPNASGSPRSDLYVFNGSNTTANVAVNILDNQGNNLTGVTISGSSPAQTYPGEAGASTVAVSAGHTRNLNWVMPTTGPNPPFDGVTNVAVSVRVTSDQPIVVGANFQSAVTCQVNVVCYRSRSELHLEAWADNRVPSVLLIITV